METKQPSGLKGRARRFREGWPALFLFLVYSVTVQAQAVDVRITDHDSSGLTLVATFPPARLEPVPETLETWHQIIVPGTAMKRESGRPMLPQHGVLIGIPEEARLSVTLLEAPVAGEIGDDIRVAPARVPADEGLLPWQRILHIEQSIDAAVYARDDWYPASLVRTGFQGRLRGRPVAQILFHPVRYHPLDRALRVHQRLQVRIEFDRPLNAESMPVGAKVRRDAFESVLRNSLINYPDPGR